MDKDFPGRDGLPSPRTTQVIHLAPALQADDRMGMRISRFDWSATPLGALPQWTPALRIAVDMMLLSPFPCALVWGSQLTVLHNDAYLGVLDGSGPALGKGFDQLWREHWPSIGRWVFLALEGEASFVEDAPVRIRRNAGSGEASYVFSYSPLRDDGGQVAGLLHTVIEASASAEQRREWHALRESFDKQLNHYMSEREHIWQLSRDAMIMVSRDMRLLAANPAWYRCLGWREDQIRGTPILELIHPADHAEVRLVANDLLAGIGVDSIETRIRHAEGYYRWFSWSARCDGDVLAAVGRDVTQEREDTLRQAEHLLRLGQRMDIVGQLASGMAHEMNNLLSGTSGSLELLQHRLAQGRMERIDEYVHLARDSVQRAMALTHHLIAFSRSQPLAAKPLDVNRLMLDLQALIRQTVGPDIDVRWQLDVAPWPVKVDARQLENALLNLCSNARDACPEQGVLTIRSTNQRVLEQGPAGSIPAGDYVAIHVQDDGHGMPAEHVARAFEPFFTTQPTGRGAGLGLAMVYGFMRQSAGHVWLESTPNKGTQVTLLFPRYRGEIPVVPASVQLPQACAGNGERLLLVDDEHNLRVLMKESLMERGFEVVAVNDGRAALASYQSAGPFDLVISDIGLPGGFSGRQVARAIRQIDARQKILLITGYTEYPVEQQLLDQPGTALMLKPFSLESLCGQVLRLLHV